MADMPPLPPVPQAEIDFLRALMYCPECSNLLRFDGLRGTCPHCGYEEDP